MTAHLKPENLSVEDYLAGEILSDIRNGYLGGAVHAMAGGTVNHALISSNVFA